MVRAVVRRALRAVLQNGVSPPTASSPYPNYAGGQGQQLRSRQIATLRTLTANKTFVDRYPELLACNESFMGIADKVDVAADLTAYFESTKSWRNYPDQIPTLDTWHRAVSYAWPDINPAHRYIVDAVKELKPTSACDVGAGAGVVAKYVHATDPSIRLTCVEGGPVHRELMQQNFRAESSVIPPQMAVPATIIDGLAQNLPLADNTQELVYTCTVMMHIPFIAAVLAACECARVSSRYVLHVEGYHVDGIPVGFRTPANLALIDYERLYRLLGFRLLRKSIFQMSVNPDYDGVVFLAEKQHTPA